MHLGQSSGAVQWTGRWAWVLIPNPILGPGFSFPIPFLGLGSHSQSHSWAWVLIPNPILGPGFSFPIPFLGLGSHSQSHSWAWVLIPNPILGPGFSFPIPFLSLGSHSQSHSSSFFAANKPYGFCGRRASTTKERKKALSLRQCCFICYTSWRPVSPQKALNQS